MLSQQLFQQPEPPTKVSKFMDKAGWPIVVGIASTTISAVIIAIWLGGIHILSFTWLMLVLGLIMVFVACFIVWYSYKTRVSLQNQHDKDINALTKEFYALQRNFIDAINNELNRSNEWRISYSQANAKEQNERIEEIKKQLNEKIADAENRMDGRITNVLNTFSGAVQSYEVAVDSCKQHLFQTEKRMDALEEQLRKNSSAESQAKQSEITPGN